MRFSYVWPQSGFRYNVNCICCLFIWFMFGQGQTGFWCRVNGDWHISTLVEEQVQGQSKKSRLTPFHGKIIGLKVGSSAPSNFLVSDQGQVGFLCGVNGERYICIHIEEEVQGQVKKSKNSNIPPKVIDLNVGSSAASIFLWMLQGQSEVLCGVN